MQQNRCGTLFNFSSIQCRATPRADSKQYFSFFLMLPPFKNLLSGDSGQAVSCSRLTIHRSERVPRRWRVRTHCRRRLLPKLCAFTGGALRKTVKDSRNALHYCSRYIEIFSSLYSMQMRNFRRCAPFTIFTAVFSFCLRITVRKCGALS